MKLFIGNLPSDALIIDLYNFLGGLELRANFEAKEGIDRDSSCYHYVVAELSQQQDIQDLVRRFDGVEFGGHSLVVRQFIERDPCQQWLGEEKRINVQ